MSTIPLLDHGYIKIIETWGSDARIIEAARMSTDKGFQGWDLPCGKCGGDGEAHRTTVAHTDIHRTCPKCGGSGIYGDERLLRYLWEHKHATPFEMAGMIVEVQAPIFVFREWHRHRTQSYNELSARYTELPNMYYTPSVERIMNAKQATSNKQSSQQGISATDAIDIWHRINHANIHARQEYETLLATGIAREVARVVIPVSQYSRMRASANLRNWLGFLSLRTEMGAQWEIRQYADAMVELLSPVFPHTMQLWENDRP